MTDLDKWLLSEHMLEAYLAAGSGATGTFKQRKTVQMRAALECALLLLKGAVESPES